MPGLASKILFKKKTPVATVKKPVDKTPPDMRIIADGNGVILDVNDVFANTLSIAIGDVKGRHLLDVILFKDFDKIANDRALFNHLGDSDEPILSRLKPGTHTILMGNMHDPYEFLFDSGVAAVTIHGRTVMQRYIGPSKWEFLKTVKEHVGDKLILQTLEGRKEFTSTTRQVIEISDTHLLQDTEDTTVTLVTCYPFYFVGHAPQRFIVTASLDTTNVNQ